MGLFWQDIGAYRWYGRTQMVTVMALACGFNSKDGYHTLHNVAIHSIRAFKRFKSKGLVFAQF